MGISQRSKNKIFALSLIRLARGVVLIFSVAAQAHGEPVWYPDGTYPIASISEKIQRSMRRPEVKALVTPAG
jgi:hypothetical protein